MAFTTRTFALSATAGALAVLLAACGGAAADTTPQGGSSSATAQGVASAGSAADISFAQLMIPHHQQAVEMADMALEQASTPEVRELAVQIKAAQDPEIQMMSDWLESWGAPMKMDGDHDSHDMGGMTMSGMMTDEEMQALAAASGADFDQMWLQMMIAHHEGAVSMADEVLVASDNPAVIALADDVIAGQAAEIDTMKQLLLSD